MAQLSSSQFMLALPNATRANLPKALQNFKTYTRGWLCQLYYTQPYLHYEVWNMGEKRGLLELGLHFESRIATENHELLVGFDRHLVEIKATLGPQWEAEPWDKGWAKVYETVRYEAFSPTYLQQMAQRLARTISVLQPIWRALEA